MEAAFPSKAPVPSAAWFTSYSLPLVTAHILPNDHTGTSRPSWVEVYGKNIGHRLEQRPEEVICDMATTQYSIKTPQGRGICMFEVLNE